MKIIINHIGYVVLIKKPEQYKGAYVLKNVVAMTQRDNKNQSTIYIKKPIKDTATLAHEIVHVLQNIADDRNISFVEEQEHFGYLMQYLMNEVTGYKYII